MSPSSSEKNIEKITIKTKGMHCVSCERLIEESLKGIDGVIRVKSDYVSEKTMIEFDKNKTDINEIKKSIEKLGYKPEEIKERIFIKNFWWVE